MYSAGFKNSPEFKNSVDLVGFRTGSHRIRQNKIQPQNLNSLRSEFWSPNYFFNPAIKGHGPAEHR
jgi:hypothetical protein